MHRIALVPLVVASLAAVCPAQHPDRPGPWDGDLILLASDDGHRFEKVRTLFEGVGVPSLAAAPDGRLLAVFQWFPEDRAEAFDRVAVSISDDDGETWSAPEPIVVEGFPESMRRPFDPTLVVLPGGGFRLYYTSHEGQRTGRIGRAQESVPRIHSAISDDGIHYRYEEGIRLEVEGEWVIDCAAARLGDEWHLLSPVQGSDGRAYHAVSADGLAFERLDDLTLDIRGAWLGCAVTTDAGLRFFGTGAGGWSARSTDGRSWTLVREARAEGAADPGVARTRGGRWLMVATGGQAGPGGPKGEGALRGGAALELDAENVIVWIDGRRFVVDRESLEVKEGER